MTTLRTQLTDDMKTAMRAKDKPRLGTVRMILAAIKDADINARASGNQDGIDDGAILSLLQKMVKQREDAAKTYDQGGRPELAEKERSEIVLIRTYLPQMLSEEEMKTAIAEAIGATGAKEMRDMGKVMAHLKANYAGQLDFGKVSGVIKARLG